MNEAQRDQAPSGGLGIRCPSCGCRHLRVLYTRPGWGGRVVRRRECRLCRRRLSTYEQAGGSREPRMDGKDHHGR